MAKKKEGEAKVETPKANKAEKVKVDLPVESDEQPENIEVEESVTRGIGEPEKKEKVTLKSTRVFEAMQGVWRTIWTKVE